MTPLKHLAEALLLVPLFWGTLAFAGWLISRATFWADLGYMALGVGLLSGGYGQEELEDAGAFRVYEDPADLLKHINEVAARR